MRKKTWTTVPLRRTVASTGWDALLQKNMALLAKLLPNIPPAHIRRKMMAPRSVVLTVLRRRRRSGAVTCAVLQRHAHEGIAELVLFGVRWSQQMRGIGKTLMERVGTLAARWWAATAVVTFASDEAVPFFEKTSFRVVTDHAERRRVLDVIDAYDDAVPMIQRLDRGVHPTTHAPTAVRV